MNKSENFFEQYLQQLGYKKGEDYEYERRPRQNRAHPADFWLKSKTPQILFQIKEFDPDDPFSKRREQQNKYKSFDGYIAKDIRRKINDCGKQFLEYKDDGYICVAAIQDIPPSYCGFKAEEIGEAMYGNLGIKVVTTTYGFKQYPVFEGYAVMTPQSNTQISAVCSLTQKQEEGNRIIKCSTVLNKYAINPIAADFFSSIHDEVWEIDRGGKFRKIKG